METPTSVKAHKGFRTYIEAVLRAREGETIVIASPNGNIVIMSEEKFNQLNKNETL